jgi:hypothetical protein
MYVIMKINICCLQGLRKGTRTDACGAKQDSNNEKGIIAGHDRTEEEEIAQTKK